MNKTQLVEKIAEKDFNVDEFVQLAITDEDARDGIVSQMVSNPAIMVYYHCYYVVAKASQKQPELFYEYWDVIAALLNHKNSYHRDFALTIIGNLTMVDQEDRFSEIAENYFAMVNDEKFMTGNSCIQNLQKVYQHKPEHRKTIIELLLDIDNRCDYTEKQIAVMKYDVLEIFNSIIAETAARDRIEDFIKAEVDCISPKTRKKAKAMIRNLALN